MSQVTLVLQSMRHGQSSEELIPLVYDELRRIALARLSREAGGQTLQPTALVHEAWLRLVHHSVRTWENRAQFLGAAALAMRRILIENARRKARLKRGGHLKRVDEVEIEAPSAVTDERLLSIDEALDRMEAVDPERARIVTLKFFGGLTNQEVAEVMGVTERTIERHWAFARAWLYQTILEHA
jgi:RNA polymerase sigma factor (TIGR02999 family)